MQTAVTVVNLVHDPATGTDTPVCRVLPGCSWRQRLGTSSAGDPVRTVHIRIPAGAAADYLPYPQWTALPAAEKPLHWTLKRGEKLVQGTMNALTLAEYARLERSCICCTVAAVSDNREPLLPHLHVEGG